MKKILVIKHGSLGDIILALPVFASIRKHYNNSTIYILTEKKYFYFFKRCPYINFCIEDERKKNLLITFIRIIKLSFQKFDLIIDLQNSTRTTIYNFLFRMFQSSRISSSRPFAHYRYYIPKQGFETVSSGLLNQLKLLGVNRILKEDYSWLEVQLREKFIQPLALFIPGVSKNGNYKQWQPYKFAEVAKYLEKLNYIICIVGNKEDQQSVLPIIESCKNILNKIEQSPPEIIYSLALKAKIIFSNDTGPGHIASLAQNSFIWIVNDNNITKANQPSGKHVYKIQSSSLKDITSKEIIHFLEQKKLC